MTYVVHRHIATSYFKCRSVGQQTRGPYIKMVLQKLVACSNSPMAALVKASQRPQGPQLAEWRPILISIPAVQGDEAGAGVIRRVSTEGA